MKKDESRFHSDRQRKGETGFQKCRAGYHQKSCDDIKSGFGLSQKGIECRGQRGWALGQIPWERLKDWSRERFGAIYRDNLGANNEIGSEPSKDSVRYTKRVTKT